MAAAGMHIGLHSYDHPWMNELSPAEQAADLDKSLRVLSQSGLDQQDWSMAYPYGAYDQSLLRHLQARGCFAAFTTVVALADPRENSALELPRLDTNDLPSSGDAAMSRWTQAVASPN
jgi:peptidoglycan/xylan/chitin deacetylase (PgdA/CDA1 family)